MFDAQQLRQLHALGLAPMHLRGHATAQVAVPVLAREEPSGNAPRSSLPVHLWFPPGEPDAFAGPHGRLLTQLLRCLDLSPEQVQSGIPIDGEAPLLLAFGPGAPQGAIRLAALAKLRDPIEKRIAWPLLRRVRRRLRQGRA